ncbi:MAG: iron-containing alcohol dehydrogenase [Lawsonibacter sp.]|nr:iron-containing alcohol dehydrogenase [Lawsonibacter sp.]
MAYANFRTTQYVLGNGSLEKLSELKEKKIALVVDEFIVKALGLDKSLYEGILAGAEFKVICSMSKEPTMELLDAPIRAMQEYAPDYIVGIGGGSVMDTAKALWLFYELPHYDWDKAMVPYAVESFPGKAQLIVVPTTSGTGSETTGCAVIKDYEKRKKMILSNEIVPTLAILDYALLKSLPPKNIAFSGTDALAHALEAAVSRISNKMVELEGIQAAVTLIRELPGSQRGETTAREKVHVAASLAGQAINNAITGMAHGMDQAGGDFGLPHGLLTGMLLPYTMRYLMPQPIYVQVAEQLGLTGSDEEKQNGLVEAIWKMYDEIGMPKTLKAVGVPEAEYLEKIASYVPYALADANIQLCPKDPTAQQLEELYRQFYYGL